VRIAVVGGKLQGLEAVYLAKKAGWQVVLIDRHKDVPAGKLCDSFFCLDANRVDELAVALNGVELIVPALEEITVLTSLAVASEKYKIPYAFDPAAYEVSASKRKSDHFFNAIGIAAPQPWPNCDYPLIAKPSGSSGSEGVHLIRNEEDMRRLEAEPGFHTKQWVIQEYLEGPSYSLEVIGCRGVYLPLQVTDLQMDSSYDCKRVIAPSELEPKWQKELAAMAVKIAAELKMNGIMDVEVIFHDGCLKVLEIDARLPSQTPTAVFKSTGVNMLELLAGCFIDRHLEFSPPKAERAVIFEHIVVSPNSLTVAGERVVSKAGSMSYVEDFFGADEALTNYCPGLKNWIATLIITAGDSQEVRRKRLAVINRVKDEMKLN